ncbi:MAG: hypothetical protein AAGJ79_14855 [Verrucomicrobiota bacterium]
MNLKSMMRCVALTSLWMALGIPAIAQEGGDLPVFAVTEVDRIRAAMGTEAKVRGTVADTGKSGAGHNFLNFSDTEFNVFVPSSSVSNFPDGEPADVYRGLEITFTGEIAEYNGKVQIVLTSPDQVTVSGGAPLPQTDPGEEADPAGDMDMLERIDASNKATIVAAAGERVRVRGFVSASNKAATTGANFLKLKDSDFTVVIFGKALASFAGGDPVTIYRDKWIEVAGMIELHRGDTKQPQMVIESPEQIREVPEPKEDPVPAATPQAPSAQPTPPPIPEGPKEVDWRDYFEK